MSRIALLADLIASIVASPLPFVVTDPRAPDNPVVAVNEAFCRLTRYRRDEALGRNCRFLQGPDSDPRARAALRAAVAKGRAVTVPILNHRSDGSAFVNAVTIAPVRDESGALAFFMGSHAEIAAGAGEVAGPERVGADLRCAFQARREAARAQVAALRPRHAQVLAELARGGPNKVVAHRLGISERMVKTHRAGLLAALGCATIAEAVRIAVEAGLAAAPEGNP